ncbi:hypothetical protein [Streptomyces sp. NPDC016675]|uniref:hypothetical protein n=1 Tax=Streptomyces sp. NPDC016675 TaxID=3364970 RepID=UPI0036F9F22E
MRWLGAGRRPVRGAVSSMLREVEVHHHTDPATGHEPAHRPAPFVQRELATVAAALQGRSDAPALTVDPPGPPAARARLAEVAGKTSARPGRRAATGDALALLTGLGDPGRRARHRLAAGAAVS